MGYPVTLTIPDDILNELLRRNMIKLDSDVIRKFVLETLKEKAFETYGEEA